MLALLLWDTHPIMLPPWRMQALLSMQCVLNRSFLASRLRSNLVMDSTLPAAIIIITITGNIIMVSVVMLIAIWVFSVTALSWICGHIHCQSSKNDSYYIFHIQPFIHICKQRDFYHFVSNLHRYSWSGLSFIIFSYLHVGKCAFGDSTLNNNEL